MSEEEPPTIDLARRRLLRIAIYSAPAVISAVVVKQAHAQTASCGPALCGPGGCNPSSAPCGPGHICDPFGGVCGPDNCGPMY
ncbi:MAG: hypothetical protein OEZ06_13420 [Myxococcales bacterium]|nr:hypothetical protein [Myxococcales bacterium]